MPNSADIPLDAQEKKRIIGLIKGIKFETLEIHPHYFNKFNQPRHGVNLDKAKEIFYQFDKIINVFKRKGELGFKYCFVYRLNKKSSYFLILLLDENPRKLFNAFWAGPEIEKRLMKKYFGF